MAFHVMNAGSSPVKSTNGLVSWLRLVAFDKLLVVSDYANSQAFSFASENMIALPRCRPSSADKIAGEQRRLLHPLRGGHKTQTGHFANGSVAEMD